MLYILTVLIIQGGKSTAETYRFESEESCKLGKATVLRINKGSKVTMSECVRTMTDKKPNLPGVCGIDKMCIITAPLPGEE